MRHAIRLGLATLVAAAAFAAPPAAANPVNPCDGQVDAACTYCSYNGGDTGHHGSHCMDRDPGYETVICALWLNGECQAHT